MKLRRNKSEQADAEAEDMPAESDADLRSRGPWDLSEVELITEGEPRVDLGGMIVTGRPGVELRLQVDEESQQIIAVLIVSEDGAVELRPFAASRNSGLWEEIRGQIAAETTRLGGTVTEADGAYGKELRAIMPVTDPQGAQAVQPSRVLGIEGPRWILRATLLGRPAIEPDPEGPVESALRDVIVVRGSAAMAPGDPLPLRMPEDAQPVPPGE